MNLTASKELILELQGLINEFVTRYVEWYCVPPEEAMNEFTVFTPVGAFNITVFIKRSASTCNANANIVLAKT